MDRLLIDNAQTYRRSENTGRGTYAVFNPPTSEFLKIVEDSRVSILEIGCGDPPRCSWNRPGLWVGCDPDIKAEIPVLLPGGVKNIMTKVVFSNIVAGVPEFKPDVICAVAPNQYDIEDQKIFNDELKKFLKNWGQQLFVIALDTGTIQAQYSQKIAINTIRAWMKVNKFGETDPNDHPILKSFHPNSGDLRGNNIRLVFERH